MTPLFSWRFIAPGPVSLISSPTIAPKSTVPPAAMPVKVTSMYGRVSSDCRLTVAPLNGLASCAIGTAADVVGAAGSYRVNCCVAAWFVAPAVSRNVPGRKSIWTVFAGSVESAVAGSWNVPVKVYL